MAKLIISEFEHEIFGRCVRLDNGFAELAVALGFGPRVLHFSLAGKENMFYNDHKKTPLDKPFDVYGGERQIMYGGHRIWLSPEIVPRCYHPDNIPVTYEKTKNGIIVKGAVEEHTKLQKIMNIAVSEKAAVVKIDHTIINHGVWDVELAVWCLTMLAAGGKAVVPVTCDKNGFLPNRVLSLWDYTDMSDKRVYWGKDFITLTQNPKIKQPFKIGLNNESGWAAYFNKGQAFIKYFEPQINGILPDNGCCYETYTNHLMLESETLSGLEILEPGDSVSHAEEWKIFETDKVPGNNENEIRGIMNDYL